MVVNFEEALQLVLAQASLAYTRRDALPERLRLLQARERVLAQPILADRDQPPFDRSTRDGFAVRAKDWREGSPVRVLGTLRAGEVWSGAALTEGTAIKIMTGAPLPAGADAVVMVEHILSSGGEEIRPADERVLARGENIVPRGAEAHTGDLVVAPGTILGAAQIALAATCGLAELAVYRRPEVAVIATGDELVEIAEVPGEQQIRNSNSYGIAAMVEAAGGHPRQLAIAADSREQVRARIAEGRRSDLMILSGGVSMGEYDLVEEVLAEFGAEFFFTGVRMQPGRPVVFGRLPPIDHATGAAPECFFFGLPGNPVSTQVTFHCFAELFLRKLAGQEEVTGPRWAQATLGEAVVGRPGLTRLLPARIEGVTVRLVAWQGSGDLAANARANTYVELLPGQQYKAGELVRVLLR